MVLESLAPSYAELENEFSEELSSAESTKRWLGLKNFSYAVDKRERVVSELRGALYEHPGDAQFRVAIILVVANLEADAEPLVPLLLSNLNSKDQRTIQTTLQTLTKVGSGAEAALPKLMELHQSGRHSGRLYDCFAAIGKPYPGLSEALSLAGKTSASNELAQVAAQRLEQAPDGASRLKMSLARGILAIDPSEPVALDYVIQALDSADAVQLWALSQLQWVGKNAASAKPKLIKLKERRNREAAEKAAEVLERLE